MKTVCTGEPHSYKRRIQLMCWTLTIIKLQTSTLLTCCFNNLQISFFCLFVSLNDALIESKLVLANKSTTVSFKCFYISELWPFDLSFSLNPVITTQTAAWAPFNLLLLVLVCSCRLPAHSLSLSPFSPSLIINLPPCRTPTPLAPNVSWWRDGSAPAVRPYTQPREGRNG